VTIRIRLGGESSKRRHIKMEADEDAKKGDSEKRTVRKSKKASPGRAPEADLKAAAEGTDQARPAPTETPARTRPRATRSVSKGAVAKEAGASGAPREAKRKATRRKTAVSPATATSSPSSPAEPTPETTPVAAEAVIVEQSPGGATLTAEPPPSLGVERPPLEEPTFEQIQLRAYFISERRRNAGLPGDDQTDWLQAREELINELKGH
jgi:hypothetical protein